MVTPANGKLSVPAAPPGAHAQGVAAAVEIRYEPSNVGDVRDVLVVSSPDGGDYVCALYGHCDAPKPQGPLVIRTGSSASVQFKNVLDTAETFNFSVDNQSFVLSKKTEKLARKAVLSLNIGYKPEDSKESKEKNKDKEKEKDAIAVAPAAAEIGKLLVTCPTNKYASWIYYLQGSREKA